VVSWRIVNVECSEGQIAAHKCERKALQVRCWWQCLTMFAAPISLVLARRPGAMADKAGATQPSFPFGANRQLAHRCARFSHVARGARREQRSPPLPHALGRSCCRHGLADLFRYLTADMAFISPHLTCMRTLILGCVASCRLCRCADLDHDDACSTLHPLTLRLCRLHPSLRATKRIALHRRIPSLQDSCLRYA
jgi:hypothetical protein